MTPLVPLDRYEARRGADIVAKHNGADQELGNTMIGVERSDGSGYEASRVLLQELPGVPAHRSSQPSLWPAAAGGYTAAANPLDIGRRFFASNGGCAYIDSNHLELATPEVRSAFDHVAVLHAMYRMAAGAVARVNASLEAPFQVKAIANNSDGLSHSYGAHINVLVSRRAWDDIFYYKPQLLSFLASHQVTSIVYAGQGKVGSENGRPWVPFQISQRADFYEQLHGWQTTHNRPVVNSRDEALCGRPAPAVRDVSEGEDVPAASALARLHCIFYDATLAHVATALKVGALQIVLCMIEAGVIPLDTLVDDPVEAVGRWSRDPSLSVRCRMAGGGEATAVEVQRRIFEHARRFVEANDLSALVPRADEVVMLWDDVLTRLEQGRIEELAGSIDWVLKRRILEDALARRPELGWRSIEAAYLDRAYGDLDPAEGLFLAYDSAGLITRTARDADIRAAGEEPPADTRAWTRARLLRVLGERVIEVDWDFIRFESADGSGAKIFRLDDPRRFTRVARERELAARRRRTAGSAAAQPPAPAPARRRLH